MAQPTIDSSQIDLQDTVQASGYSANLAAGSPPARSMGGGPYTNNTGNPIMVYAFVVGVEASGSYFDVDGVMVSGFADGGAGTNDITHSVLVPNGSTYQLNGTDGTLTSWYEVQ